MRIFASPVGRLFLLSTVSFAFFACVARGPGPRREEARDDRRDARFDARSPWDKLGERWVNGQSDSDLIRVGRADGRFRKIQLVVEHSALELFDVVVVFGDGTRFSPGTRLVFGPGSTSRVIDLPGNARVIRHVEFRYGNLPGGGRAQIELWGV
jgi:hypothetical protein